ncbi:hypothetical protein BO99DRAFT_404081 [Aspergillus violaceofuscus CBS 115571]|uniref:Uncharacterized protein n=1 Tax=Aspergillus violaceofuscus (strain CBS 115571) TaxID=1450538 RepID=A0A2V5H7L9_ASPV1|nr:hypothetical protein BO99DRAFT_404081 [Aspergillus violaceofuscus CBS 115571]
MDRGPSGSPFLLYVCHPSGAIPSDFITHSSKDSLALIGLSGLYSVLPHHRYRSLPVFPPPLLMSGPNKSVPEPAGKI